MMQITKKVCVTGLLLTAMACSTYAQQHEENEKYVAPPEPEVQAKLAG